MKAKIALNWLVKLFLRFTLQKLEKLGVQKIIPKFFDTGFQDFFLDTSEKVDRNRSLNLKEQTCIRNHSYSSFSSGNCNSKAILIFSASAGSNTSCIWPNVMLSKFLCHQHESTWSLFSVSIAMAKRNHIGAEYFLKLLHL